MGALSMAMRVFIVPGMIGAAMTIASPVDVKAESAVPDRRAPDAPEAMGEGMGRWYREMAEASHRFGLPVAWIEQVMLAESRGMTLWQGRPITSRAGAMGLMQLMPATWAAMREALGLGEDPYDPRDNILAGTAYLRAMYDRFGYPGLFAAYNAGPGRYQASLMGRRALPVETRDYLLKVSRGTSLAVSRPVEAVRPAIFVVLGKTIESGVTGADRDGGEGREEALFVVRKRL